MSSNRVARRAAMVGRDDLIAPPTRNEDKPDPCEVKQNKGKKGMRLYMADSGGGCGLIVTIALGIVLAVVILSVM